MEKEWYSLEGTFLNAVNSQQSKQLQNYGSVFDVSSQIQTDMYVLELRVYELEFMFSRLKIHRKDFIVTNRSSSMNDSKRPAAISLNALSVFDDALTMF